MMKKYNTVMKLLDLASDVEYINIEKPYLTADTVAEWLRRWIANPLYFVRAGSNPATVVFF